MVNSFRALWIARSSMACMSASSAPVAPPLAPPTGMCNKKSPSFCSCFPWHEWKSILISSHDLCPLVSLRVCVVYNFLFYSILSYLIPSRRILSFHAMCPEQVERGLLPRTCRAHASLPMDRRLPWRVDLWAFRLPRWCLQAVSLPHHHELLQGLS